MRMNFLEFSQNDVTNHPFQISTLSDRYGFFVVFVLQSQRSIRPNNV